MKRSAILLLFIMSLLVPILFLGCGSDGSDGSSGFTSLASTSPEPAGSNCANGGTKIETGLDLNGNGILDPGEVTSTSYVCNGTGAAASVRPESCSICHNGNIARDGVTHQESYKELYQDGVIVIANLAYTNNGTSDIVTFNMTKAGLPFDCTKLDSYQDPPAGTGSSLGIYFTEYDAASRSFNPPAPLTSDLRIGQSFSVSGSGTITPSTLSYNAGTNLCTSTKAQSTAGDLSARNGLIVVYGRNEARSAEEESPELRFTRVVQAKYPFAAVLKTGTVNYASVANVAGCEKCHTVPFLKHGYIYGLAGGVAGTDFYTCKACHDDNGKGSHFEWQLLVNDPPRAASFLGFPPQFPIPPGPGIPLTDPEKAQYAYRTRLMNDVHMSHAMEFPYPQSMSNCVVCHEGNLGATLTDENFVVETCKSCHPVNGGTDALGDNNKDGKLEYTVDTRTKNLLNKQAPALVSILPAFVPQHAAPFTIACNACHNAGPTGFAPLFNEIHTGYDKTIYADAAGTKYSAVFTVTIDNASFANNRLTFGFHATESPDLPGLAVANIRPTVLVGPYGYNTKDYYVGPHDRDIDNFRNLEYEVGATNHPRFTTVSAGGGSWVVTADLSAWAAKILDNVGTIRKVEIAVLPRLVNPALDNAVVALNAPSRTFDLGTNAFVPNYYSGANALVKVAGGCNNCHDALADTFHTPDRGGNIVVCRLCHITKDRGSHLEMQSRSIDSYAHAIHSFQPFDIDRVLFNDPVEAMHYEEHTRFAFPTLGRTNCEGCHVPGKYNVPDQSKSLPGALSASEYPIVFKNLEGFPDGQRNIGEVPDYVTGPATRACGGCHRVEWINEDAAGELASFYSHTNTFGYLADYTDDDSVVQVIDAIMGMI